MKIAIKFILFSAVITACGGRGNDYRVHSADTQNPIGYNADDDGVLLDAHPPSLYEHCLAHVRGYDPAKAKTHCETLMKSMQEDENPDWYGYGSYPLRRRRR